MKSFCFSILFFISISVSSQDSTYLEKEILISKWIDGTLLTPKGVAKPDLVIIIAGSGPTNRDGNQNFMKNNALKKLAIALGQNGIASFRYDKRVVKQIRQGNIDKNTMFDDFVTDATDVISFFQSDENFNKLIVLGHSQGSLVGILAAKEQADGFVSLAGAGQNIGNVIADQISNTAPMFTSDTDRIISSLKKGETTRDYPQALSSVFNLELQPFMINWMQYNPSEEITKLKIPILLINGTKDLQVPVEEAEMLQQAQPSSELILIENMNHVLFEIRGDELENAKSYNESQRPISKKLIESITNFIQELN